MKALPAKIQLEHPSKKHKFANPISFGCKSLGNFISSERYISGLSPPQWNLKALQPSFSASSKLQEAAGVRIRAFAEIVEHLRAALRSSRSFFQNLQTARGSLNFDQHC